VYASGFIEKGAACKNKRPKSREETPKEGGGNARRYRTAINYTASHKMQGVLTYFPARLLGRLTFVQA